MSKLFLAFRSFKPELLEATEALFAAKPWAMTDDEGALATTQTTETCVTCGGTGYVEDTEADGPDGDYESDSTDCGTCGGLGETIVTAVPAVEGALTANDKRLAVGQAWLDAACVVYNMPPVVLVQETWRMHTMYVPSPDDDTPARIIMPTFKLVALFAAFAEHRGDNSMSKAGQNPTGFAYSLYYSVRPRMFRRLVRENKMHGVRVRDLYREETWRRIEAHNLDPSRPDVLSVLARIDAGEEVVGSTTILGADEEAAMLAELAGEADMDRLRALASSDEDEGEDEWSEVEAELPAEPIEPESELVEEPEVESDGTPVSESDTPNERERLEAMNRDEVRTIARSHGILNPSSRTKSVLIDMILGAQAVTA